MRAKRYEVRIEDYGNLLARIKDEMGSDVLIQTRRFKKGGMLGIFGVQDWVEVLAAPKPVEPRQVVRDAVEISATGKKKSQNQLNTDNDRVFTADTETKPGIDTSDDHASGIRKLPDYRQPISETRGQIAPPNEGNGNLSLRQEIRELKKMVEDMARLMSIGKAHSTQPHNVDAVKIVTGSPDLVPVEQEALSQVIEWDIHPQRALKLVKAAISENPYNIDTLTVDMLLKRVKKVIAGDILLAEGIKLPNKDEGTVVAFIGATGVGKTTTIAKLAAQFGVRDDRKVALVSLDTYRVGAQEQLRTYADIMKLPIAIVFNADEYRHACDKYRQDHIVLVDTAGRSPFNDEHMHELREAFRAAPPDNIQLVVDACTKADDIKIMLEKFSGIGFDHIIISKLDETGSLGSVYTINCLTNRPISYFNVGQGVPDDIRVASVEFIQKWINTGKF